MKKILYIAIVVLICLILTACQESESTQLKRARLISNENLNLKKQLAEKDKQIEALKKEIEKINTQTEQERQQSAEGQITIVQMFTESEKRNEELTAENERLKAEIKDLKEKAPN